MGRLRQRHLREVRFTGREILMRRIAAHTAIVMAVVVILEWIVQSN